MRRTAWQRLLAAAAGSTVLTYAVLRIAESRGVALLPPPVVSVLVVLLIAGVVLAMGWAVRQYAQGNRPNLDPLVAARTVVLATAAAWTGALLTGWYAGQVLVVVGDLEIAARRDVAEAAGAALVGTVLLAVVGLVVERWCEVKPPDDAPGTGLSAGAAT
ncbi:DUF3180 domain-containing protein [Actinotalea sp.]|uniref:DUF3180 domain-containing protein n=1 Tax=Actinotalea sp. TaxID=1872145 RepID=UPI002BF0BFD4|nr:DUF3180 domain-containing protein [Actinotalea sp.]HRA50167.1 DUF3180 domain-containing protein [Actinotalea sp.]